MKLKSILTTFMLGLMLTGCTGTISQDDVYKISNKSWRWVLDREYSMLASVTSNQYTGNISIETVVDAKISFHGEPKAFFTISTTSYSFGALCSEKELKGTVLSLNNEWLKAIEQCHDSVNSIGIKKMLELNTEQIKAIFNAGYLKVDGNNFPMSGFKQTYLLSLNAALASGKIDKSSYTSLQKAVD
ncbi:hypothetical protein [Vibrio parahaemolyticus]|uniref:hypothetical protein n=1 Tax=Vibrio parahaemolyticus TaxID=670 RepID=UPI0011106A0A|nr:hypothetical protein [Vibrio parahaemolyticus]TMX39475.1 hypothetical protein DA098_09305 [Vibrio parahaemolyticus]TMX80459.1 hypothetical protein DA094_02675 [Vibrio parahaemolyticus]